MRPLNAVIPWPRPSTRFYLHARGGVEAPQTGRGRAYWLVSRELCRFVQVPLLLDATIKQQLDALALQVTRLSPFRTTGSHFHLGGEFISLWLWDQAMVREAADAVGADVERLRILPETAMRPPGGDGVRLVEALDGVEGQHWSQGSLAASRWWPAPPDQRAWMLFQRGASVSPADINPATPEPLQLGWLDRPWTRTPSTVSLGLAQIDLQLVVAGLGAALLVAYGYTGSEWLRLARDVHAAAITDTSRLGTIEPVLQARTTALENEKAIDGLLKLDRYPSQITMLTRVAQILPHNETHLTDWTFDRGQLQVSIAADHRLDAVYFVKALEGTGMFKQVAAERGINDNSLRVRMTVQPK